MTESVRQVTGSSWSTSPMDMASELVGVLGSNQRTLAAGKRANQLLYPPSPRSPARSVLALADACLDTCANWPTVQAVDHQPR